MATVVNNRSFALKIRSGSEVIINWSEIEAKATNLLLAAVFVSDALNKSGPPQ